MRHAHHPTAECRGDAGDFGGRLPGLGEGHEPVPEGVEIDISGEHCGDERLDVGCRRMAAAAEPVDLLCQRQRGRWCPGGFAAAWIGRIGHGEEGLCGGHACRREAVAVG